MSRDLTSWVNAQTDTTSTLKRRIADLETRDNVPPVYLEYIIPSGTTKPGVSAPTSALRAIGAAGTVLMSVQQFSNINQNDVYFEFHIPKDCDVNTPIQFHIMWLPGAAWSAGNYLWKLEYLVKEEDDPYNTGTPNTLPMDITPANATDMIETEFTGTITGVTLDSMIVCHFYRDIADTGDSTGDVNFFEFKYRSNRRGSAT